MFLIDTAKYLFICLFQTEVRYTWLLPYSWAAERGRPILAHKADPGCFHLWLEPLSFLGTTITAPPQYFYVWDVLKGNNRSVISFT